MNPIIILTGPVHSGKTTALQKWTAANQKVAGILTPLIGDERFFYDIGSGGSFPMNASADEVDILSVGKFSFSAKNFKKASDILINACNENRSKFIVIDEIGPLELVQQKGFYEALQFLSKQCLDQQLILTVRDNCIEQIAKWASDRQLSTAIRSKEDFENASAWQL